MRHGKVNMMYKLDTVLVSIALLIVIASPILCQKRTSQRQTSDKQTPRKEGPAAATKIYTLEPFNLNLANLPPNYLGHDPKVVCDALSRVSSNARKGKDEFETTEAYQNRIRNSQVQPLIGDLTTNSLLAFVYRHQDVNYDADQRALEVIVRLEEDNLGGPKPERMLSLDYETTPGKPYVGQNAYGASVVVEKEYADSWDLMFTNYAKLAATKHRDKSTDINPTPSMYDAFIKRLEMDIPTAKQARRNLRLLIICKPVAPWASNDKSYIGPTLRKPKDITWTQHMLHIELVEIWYYDLATGQVYAKQK